MKKKFGLILGLSVFSLMIIGITLAYFLWESEDNSNVSFTVNGLDDYLVYSKGTDVLEDELVGSDSYKDGVYSSVNLYKSSAGASKTLYGHFYLNTVTIGSNIINDSAFKWVLVRGDNTSSDIISQGNFSEATSGGTLTLATNQELSSTNQVYTLWFWIDSSAITSTAMEGESLNTILNVEVTENLLS